MEGFTPHRPIGGADHLPPNPNSQPQPQPQPYWYPPPPPPPPSYHHHYPPPPPHNQQCQWPPPPPYLPQPQPHQPHPLSLPHAYPPAPPPPIPMPPHQHMPPYPSPHQAWTNQPWPPNQGQHYPGASIPPNEGEDWAAKAKAWAAANSTTGRPVDHSYLQQKEVSHANGETPLVSMQNTNAGLGLGGGIPAAAAAADPAMLASPVKNFDSFSAVYEQEVPSYSSSQDTKDHQHFPVPPVQDRFYHQQPDPGYMVNYGHNAHAAPVGVAGHDPAAAPHLWAPTGSGGPYPPTNLSHPAQQYDIPTAVHPSMPLPNYVPPTIPPVPFNAPPVASHLNTELYHGDPTALTQVNQTKKSAVPSWLREEILKKKTTLGSNPSAQVGSDGGERSPEATDQTDSKSVDSTKSAEEDNDEDEVEAARTMAINQEIKRILTEVLLKVTDDLFDEIAIKVLNEDDMAGEGTSDPTTLVKSKAHGSAPSTSGNTKTQHTGANGSAINTKAVVHDESTKGGGVLLGLSDYDTDDDDGDHENASIETIKQNQEPKTDNTSSLMKKGVISNQNLVNYEDSTKLKPKGEDAEVLAHSERIVDTSFEEESHAKEDSHAEVETDRATEGERSLGGFVDGNDNMERSKVMMDSEDGFEDKRERSREGSGSDLREIEEKSEEEKDETMDGNILKEKRQRSSEDDRETERNEDKENKLDDLKDNKREISKEEKNKTTERDSKASKKEKSKEEKERKTESRDDKEDSSKDRKERSREEKERRAEKRDDGEHSLRGKNDRGKEDKEREMGKKDDKDRSRRSRRSRSPRGRSWSKEHSRATREHSESTKRRRTDSNRRSMSRSPPRSRHRRDSRSPHSKHSHHRNSAYSTADRRRSKSRTPTRRQRSRSRTPSRRR